MPISKRDIEVIDQFVLGRLNVEEQKYFDTRIADPDFSHLLDEQKELVEVIREKGRNISKAKLKALESTIQSEVRSIPFLNSRYKYAVAAMFILLVSASLWLYSPFSNEASLYDEYYAAYPNLIDPLTKGDGQQNLSPYQLYELQEYDQVISILRDNQSTDALWYTAQSYIAQGDFEKGKSSLAIVEQLGSTEYSDDVQWYQALVYLKLGQEEEAKQRLVAIANDPQHNYLKRAKSLLAELN